MKAVVTIYGWPEDAFLSRSGPHLRGDITRLCFLDELPQLAQEAGFTPTESLPTRRVRWYIFERSMNMNLMVMD